MANKKISELDSRASLSLSDLLAVGDPTTGYLYKITITDLKTLTGAGVVSFNGRVGSVTPAEGDYTLNQLGDVIITTATNNDVLRYNGSNWVNAQLFTGTIAQYVDGTGAYQTFPTLLSSDRLVTEVRNTTGATVTKGTVIYLSGSSGTLPLIAKAQANSEATSSSTYGVVQNDIANNANGYVVVIGNLTGINTSAYNAGDILWLSPTVAGGVTTTKPSAPNNSVYIGIVTRSNSTQGTIEVKVQNGYELDELHNVAISSVANNEVLVYESATTLWKNKTIPTILGYTPANAANFVPYTGATGSVNLGSYNLTATNVYSSYAFSLTNELGNAYFGGMLSIYRNPSFTTNINYANIFAKNGTSLSLYLGSGSAYKQADINLSGLTNDTLRTYSLPDASGTIALTSNLGDYLQLSGGTLTGEVFFNVPLRIKHTTGLASPFSGYNSISADANGYFLASASLNFYAYLNISSLSNNRTFTLPDSSGTIALTSNLSSYVPTSRTITINGTAYDLSADRAWTVSGSQWTTSGSDIYYNTGNVAIGGTSPTFSAGTGLYINSATRSNLTLTNGTSNFNFFQDGADGYINMQSTGNIIFRTTASNTTRLTIANNGAITATGSLTADGVTIGASDIRSSSGTLTLGGTTERVRINSTGVGIGTNSPTQPLHVYSTSSTTSTYFETNAANSYIGLKSTSGVCFIGNVGYALTFEAGGAERMRLKSANGGTLVFGSAEAAANSFNFYGNYSNSQPGYAVYGSTANLILEFNGNTKALYIGNLGTGLVYSNAGILTSTNPSDERLKENIVDINYGLKDILKLRPVKYNWKNDKINQGIQFGFIAQEVKEIMPDSIKEFGEDVKYLGLEKDAIYATLVNAIQEQQIQIEQLKAQIK